MHSYVYTNCFKIYNVYLYKVVICAQLKCCLLKLQPDFHQSIVLLPPLQPVDQNPQPVVPMSLIPHDRVKSRLVRDSYKVLPAATVKDVPVSIDQSNEYSAYVLPESDSKGIC